MAYPAEGLVNMDTTTPGQSGPRSNGNERIILTPQSSSLTIWFGVVSHTDQSFLKGLTQLQGLKSGNSKPPNKHEGTEQTDI